MTAPISEAQRSLIRRLLRERVDEVGDTWARVEETPTAREASAIIDRLLRAPAAPNPARRSAQYLGWERPAIYVTEEQP